MFETSLNSSWDERSRRGITALTSFGLQALAVAVLLIIPLLRPAGLPLFHSLSTPVSEREYTHAELEEYRGKHGFAPRAEREIPSMTAGTTNVVIAWSKPEFA